MILQRWEPVVSETFPSSISFWIKVHGVPLHFWSEATFNVIGSTLGTIEGRDFEKARMKVQINGLEPLVMKMDLQLPSKVIEVEIEYEGLEKHCFYCKALSHEEDDCDVKPPSLRGEKRSLGISQYNTLEKIEESKKRQDARKQTRLHQEPSRGGARWTNYRNATTRDTRRAYDEYYKTTSEQSSGFEENRRRYEDRSISARNYNSRRSPSRRDTREQVESGNSPHSHTREPPVLPSKTQKSPARISNSHSHQSPAADATTPQRRSNLASRLSDPREPNTGSEERISARDRLSVHTQRTSQNAKGNSIGSSRQLHEVEIQDFEENLILPITKSITRPSCSTVFDSGRLGPCERSPIRTLSEDRIHVSLRLGPLIQSEGDESDSQILELNTLSKAAGKKKMVASQSRKRGSPAQGTAVKRRRVTKAHPSPKRKLMMDAITTGGKVAPATNRRTAPACKIIPPVVKKKKDFHHVPASLP